MFGTDYGPFATIVATAAILVALFSTLLLKAVGKVSQWTFLAGGPDSSPSFMITAGARALAIALIVLTFIFINKSDYFWFGGGAAVCGLLMIILIGRFDRMRQTHTCKVPELDAGGNVKKGWFGAEKSKMVVIGTESDMKADAAAKYKELKRPGLRKFLSGYGTNEVNNPAAIWTEETLAKISSNMNLLVIGILLCGVMALYLSASVIEVHQRPAAATSPPKQP
jgi:hypothetical protein